MPLKVIFVRHGESQANIDRVFANRISLPGELTPAGISEATALAARLKPLQVSHIYTSPLARAHQTAAILAGELHVSVLVSSALREYDVGDFEGLAYTGDGEWRWERYEAVEQAWREGRRDARHPEGESLSDLIDRFSPFMSSLTARHRQSDTLVAVGHGGLFRATLPLLFVNLALDDLCSRPIHHGDMIVGIHANGAWVCESWGDEIFMPTT